MKKLVGRTDIEDALKRLDKLTQDEVRMATAQLLKITHGVDDKVIRIDDGVKGINDKVKGVSDTVNLVLNGASRTFPADSVANVYMARWKRDQSSRATDSTRVENNYATHAEQC